MKSVEFISKAAMKEYMALPDVIRDDFNKDITVIQKGGRPYLAIAHLDSVGRGVIELKINGSPAYRCLYVAKYKDVIVILGAFVKTTNGQDKAIQRTGRARFKKMLDRFGPP